MKNERGKEMRTYAVTVTVKAEDEHKAVDAVIEFLNAGGDPDSIEHEPDAAEFEAQS